MLHQYIFDSIVDWNDEIIRAVGTDEDLILSYQKTITIYNHGFCDETSYPHQNEYDDERDYAVYLFKIIRENILKDLSDEVFYILFGDREFLLKFNELCSKEISTLNLKDHTKILEADGVLKRPKNWNTWVKNAIRFRDKEECVHCGRDLTAQKKSTNKPELDHIVSLKESGSNDITNIQYSCNQCNNEKNDSTQTSRFYIPYYEYDK